MIFRKKKDKNQVVRIEDLEALLSDPNAKVDPEAIVSMYMPRRNVRRFGAALLRLDRMRLALILMIALVAGLFILAFMQEKMGNFTINLNRLELYRRGIALSADANFSEPSARLTASTVQGATNITLEDIPANVDELEGDHNGRNYMAFSYFVRNAGKEDVGYVASVNIGSYSKGAEKAVRVVVYHNGERTVYAAPASDGKPEPGCKNFESANVVCTFTENDFLVGNVDKFTIVIYMEGEDPDCVDDIVGGAVTFSMDINAVENENTSLWDKFVRDIKEMLSGDRNIGASGNNAPGYYYDGELNWYNRKNQ